MADESVRIEGLSGLRKGLRKASPDGLVRALSAAHKKVAQLVVDDADPQLTTKYGRRARSQMRASGTTGGAFVRLSGPTAFGDEFGATRYTQFRPHKGTTGYAVYPTIRAKRSEIEDTYGDLVESEVLERIARESD